MNQTIKFEYENSLVLSHIYHLMNEEISENQNDKFQYYKRISFQSCN